MWPSSPQHLLLSSKCLIWTSSLNPLTLAVLLPEAAISGLLWASFRWRFKRKKKKCATAGKRGWAEWFKGHSCQRVLVQTPGTFYIICRSYRTSSQMSCTTKKSSPYTIDPNNKNVITIKFVTGPHGSLANPFIVILNFSTKKNKKKHIHSTWFHSGFFFIRSHLPPTMQQHSHHWEPTQNQQDEF